MARLRGRLPSISERSRRRTAAAAGLAGLIGGLACSTAMVLAAVGVVGVGAATVGASAGSTGMSSMSGMNAMSGTAPAGSHPRGDAGPIHGVVALLLDRGPTILVLSIALVALAVGLRRARLGVPALAVGGALYWGMYVQRQLSLMYATIAVSLLLWGVLLVLGRRVRREGGEATVHAAQGTPPL